TSSDHQRQCGYRERQRCVVLKGDKQLAELALLVKGMLNAVLGAGPLGQQQAEDEPQAEGSHRNNGKTMQAHENHCPWVDCENQVSRSRVNGRGVSAEQSPHNELASTRAAMRPGMSSCIGISGIKRLPTPATPASGSSRYPTKASPNR